MGRIRGARGDENVNTRSDDARPLLPPASGRVRRLLLRRGPEPRRDQAQHHQTGAHQDHLDGCRRPVCDGPDGAEPLEALSQCRVSATSWRQDDKRPRQNWHKLPQHVGPSTGASPLRTPRRHCAARPQPRFSRKRPCGTAKTAYDSPRRRTKAGRGCVRARVRPARRPLRPACRRPRGPGSSRGQRSSRIRRARTPPSWGRTPADRWRN